MFYFRIIEMKIIIFIWRGDGVGGGGDEGGGGSGDDSESDVSETSSGPLHPIPDSSDSESSD